MRKIAAANALIFRSILDQGRSFSGSDILEWISTVAWFASRNGWFGALSSPELEGLLLKEAQSIPVPQRGGKAVKWLHVLTEAYGTLGHTNLCRRWIEADKSVVHDVIILGQRGDAPENLVVAAQASGGGCVVLDATLTAFERVGELRRFAWENAAVVVLHTHPEDVIATTAFGIRGGPPVLYVNHADHVFWVGCSVADLVLDIRESGHRWTTNVRGVKRASILPLPLPSTEHVDSDSSAKEVNRKVVREKLGIRENEVMVITVGHPLKYDPVPGLSFVDMAVKFLKQCPNAKLVAVGPSANGSWGKSADMVGGRLMALGFQPNAKSFCEAADIYLEGFPAGSLTALLEAAESGLACVRAPRICSPPFASDSPGLECAPQPATLEDYVSLLESLTRDTRARESFAAQLQADVRKFHCGDNWLRQLELVKARIPSEHSVYPDFISGRVDDRRRDWLLQYLFSKGLNKNRESLLKPLYLEAWRRTNGCPQVSPQLWERLGEIERGAQNPDKSHLGALDCLSLWWLNVHLRWQGLKARLLARADLAFRTGKPELARQLTYSCLMRRLSSIFDPVWIKLFAKTHLGSRFVKGLRHYAGC